VTDELNGEEGAEQRTEHSVPAEKRSVRVDRLKWSTDNSQMLTAKSQAEGRNLDTKFTLIYEFKPGTPNERFLWNALKQKEETKYCRRKEIPRS